METKICWVPGGKCGHGAYDTGVKKWPRSALAPIDLKAKSYFSGAYSPTLYHFTGFF